MDIKNIADDSIWELQEQLRNVSSNLFLEKTKNAELQNSLHMAMKNRGGCDDASAKNGETSATHHESTLKRNYDLRIAKSRIFGVEPSDQSFNLQLGRNKKKPLLRVSAEPFKDHYLAEQVGIPRGIPCTERSFKEKYGTHSIEEEFINEKENTRNVLDLLSADTLRANDFCLQK